MRSRRHPVRFEKQNLDSGSKLLSTGDAWDGLMGIRVLALYGLDARFAPPRAPGQCPIADDRSSASESAFSRFGEGSSRLPACERSPKAPGARFVRTRAETTAAPRHDPPELTWSGADTINVITAVATVAGAHGRLCALCRSGWLTDPRMVSTAVSMAAATRTDGRHAPDPLSDRRYPARWPCRARRRNPRSPEDRTDRRLSCGRGCACRPPECAS